MRSRSLLLAAVLAAAAACSSTDAPTPDAGAPDAGDDGPPSWLGDAGLATREPVAQPLHTLCGIASNPGDFPLGQDAASASLRAGYFTAAKDLGGVMIRRDFAWPELEPAKGSFAFAPYDALVAQAKTAGVRLLGTLDYGTIWAHKGALDAQYPPDDPLDFASYAGKVAARYAGELAGWEIWNEPNNGFRFWKGTELSGDPAAYGALLIDAYAAIHAVDPKTPVLLGGTVFTPQLIQGAIPWLERAYAAHPDLGKSFDVAGVHTYMLYPPSVPPERAGALDPPLEAKLGMHAWLLAQHDRPDAPLWITELGWPVAGQVDEAAQARYLVRVTILAAHAGASGIFWYTLRDGPAFSPSEFPPEDDFGLLHYDADPAAKNPPSPKPSYVSLRALLAIVGERWPAATERSVTGGSARTRAVSFHGGSGVSEVVALWTEDGEPVTIQAPFAGKVMNQDGSARGAASSGSPVALTGDVTYVVAP